MVQVRKNQIVVTTLVTMIAVAGYLNFNHKEEVISMAETEPGYSYEALIDDSADITVLADDVESEIVQVTEISEFSEIEGVAMAEGLDPLTAEADYENDDTGAAVLVNLTQESTEYFAQAKLEREQSRAKQKDMLTEMLSNENLDASQRDLFAENMLTIQERIEKETAAEAMIEAKGFAEAYVRIDDETVDVVVSGDELTSQEVAQIEDIVNRKTGLSTDKIKISTLK